MEHCLFYSGELYKICESESFIPQGFKAAKDTFKKKNISVATGGGGGGGSRVPAAAGGGGGSRAPASASHDGARGQKRETSHSGKQKQSGAQNSGNLSRTGGTNQNNGNGMNNWGLRRSDASLWLSLINKLSKKSLLPVWSNIIPFRTCLALHSLDSSYL